MIAKSKSIRERYIDFDQMEYMPEIASSIDIYADEMTTHSQLISYVKHKMRQMKRLNSFFIPFIMISSMLIQTCSVGLEQCVNMVICLLYLDIDEHEGIKKR